MLKQIQARLRFENLFKFVYFVSKLSGYVFITMDFEGRQGLRIRRIFSSLSFLVVSFAFSIFSFSYNSYVPIVEVTQSQLSEFGINLVSRVIAWSPFCLKLLNLMQSGKISQIFVNIEWCDKKVNFELMPPTTNV